MTIEKRTPVVAVIASLALMVLAGSAIAGHPGKGDRFAADPASHAARLTEVLSLNEAQAADVEQILTEARAERQSIGDSYTLNQRAEARKAMRALHDRTSERIYALLDDEQKETYDAMRERRKMRAEHRKEKMELRKKQRAELRGEG